MRHRGSLLLFGLALGGLAAPRGAAAQCTDDPARGEARPELSGPPADPWLDPTGRFRLHWTEAGVDAPTNLSDGDGNGLPDFADRAMEGLWRGDEEFPDLGYRRVPPDDGGGGDDAIDVYFLDLPVNGYAFQVPSEAGSDAGSSCVIQLDGGLGNSLPGVLESVAAHELHHCTQYAHTTSAPPWLLESTATFEQYRMFRTSAMLTALSVLWRVRLREPERPIDSQGARFEYAGFVFEHFWESFGLPFGEVEHGRIPDLWEALRASPGDWEAALEAESLRIFDQSFPQTFLDFAAWNAFACDRSDAAHYGFERFPCDIEASVPVTAVQGSRLTLELPEAPFAAAYAEIEREGDTRPVELRCAGPGGAGARARVRLVALDGFGRASESADVTAREGDGFTVRLSGSQPEGGRTLVVFASTGGAGATLACDVARVEPAPDPDDPSGEGEGCASCGDGGAAAALLGIPLWVLPKRRRRRGSPDAVA
jgi:hypothetical protein